MCRLCPSGNWLSFGCELGDRDCIAKSLKNLGVVSFVRGKLGDANSLYREAVAIRLGLGVDRMARDPEVIAALQGIAFPANPLP